MDAKYLEFLSQLFLAAARGQQQLDEIAQWVRQGAAGSEALTRLWLQSYGLSADPEKGADVSADAAAADFKRSFDAFLGLFGVVAESDYRQLKEKYERLQQQSRTQQQTIAQLKQLLADKGRQPELLAQEFADMVSQQTNQFNDLLGTMTELLATPKEKEK